MTLLEQIKRLPEVKSVSLNSTLSEMNIVTVNLWSTYSINLMFTPLISKDLLVKNMVDVILLNPVGEVELIKGKRLLTCTEAELISVIKSLT
jgi:hypothetical protein